MKREAKSSPDWCSLVAQSTRDAATAGCVALLGKSPVVGDVVKLPLPVPGTRQLESGAPDTLGPDSASRAKTGMARVAATKSAVNEIAQLLFVGTLKSGSTGVRARLSVEFEIAVHPRAS